MMKKLMGVLLCLILIVGCGTKSDSPKSQQQNNESLDIQGILSQADVMPQYIETEDFSGEELKIVNILNSLMKYNLSDDIPGIVSLYSETHPSKNEDHEHDHVLSLIVSMESLRFNFTSEKNTEVTIKQSDITIADPEKNVNTTNKIYYMVKENEEWKIASIQN